MPKATTKPATATNTSASAASAAGRDALYSLRERRSVGERGGCDDHAREHDIHVVQLPVLVLLGLGVHLSWRLRGNHDKGARELNSAADHENPADAWPSGGGHQGQMAADETHQCGNDRCLLPCADKRTPTPSLRTNWLRTNTPADTTVRRALRCGCLTSPWTSPPPP